MFRVKFTRLALIFFLIRGGLGYASGAESYAIRVEAHDVHRLRSIEFYSRDLVNVRQINYETSKRSKLRFYFSLFVDQSSPN